MSDNDIVYGSPTMVDYARAWSYAVMQVNKMKCEDPELLKKLCANNETCFQWVQDRRKQTFDIPDTVTDQECKVDADCKGGLECITNPEYPRSGSPNVCGYKPKDVAAGFCRITSQQLCEANSELPYTCDTDPSKPCISKSSPPDCKTGCTGPSHPYLEWHPANEGGKCIIGNFALREWCEQPGTRCTQNSDGSYPPTCKGSSASPGVTDVPPFFYNKNTGKCHMTHGYCKNFGVDYNMGECSSDGDCPGDAVCYTDSYNDKKYCSGPTSKCYRKKGQKIGEDFFVGKTIFRAFKKHGRCTLFEGFEDFQNSVEVLADPRLMEKKVKIGNNFGGNGINLYYIIWREEANMKRMDFCGFISTEIANVYPSLIKKINGREYISINNRDAEKDKNLKRIYGMCQSGYWLAENVTKIIQKLNK